MIAFIADHFFALSGGAFVIFVAVELAFIWLDTREESDNARRE